jgi:hypothetical protein
MRRAVCALALLLVWQEGQGGAFIFAIDNDQVGGTPRTLTHSPGYTGVGGTLTVTVCIANDSESKALLRDPVLNAIDRFNQGVPVIGNLREGGDNDIPSGAIDVESTIFHELGHCQGLAHPNMASESGNVGVSSADWEYTKSTPNGQFDFGLGPDGLRGSPDDLRGDDTNFHWFEVGVNNPFRLPLRPDIDPASYSVDLEDLPAGDSFAANGERNVAAGPFGLPATEAVMQQGQGFDEDQRALTADDVATLAIARAGFDRTVGTADDYTVELVYGGDDGSGDCDIDVRMSGSSFAFCQVGGTNIGDDQVTITSALAQFASTSNVNWHFTDERIPAPGPDGMTVVAGGSVTVLDSGENSLLANDTQPEGKGLSLDPATYGGPEHGTVVLNGDGTFSYTHADDGSDQDFFIYRVCVDGTGTCSYQQVDVTIETVPTASIAVISGATPASVEEPGGDVTIEVDVQNDSTLAGTLTVDGLTDSAIGSLDGQGTCALPQALAQDQSYTCSYTASVSGNSGDVDTRTITADGTHDADGSVSDDDEVAVTISDVPPSGDVIIVPDPATIDEPGGNISWTVTVANSSSAESLALSELVDDRNGDLAGRGTCSLPQTIAADDSYTCGYEAQLLAEPGQVVTTTTALLGDDDGGNAQPQGQASITVADVEPALEATLTAEPTVVGASGESVTFTVAVENTSPGDAVSLTALDDDALGTIDGRGDCSLPASIDRGASYTCSYTDTLSGPAGTETIRTVMATAEDQEANSAQADDTATLQFEDDAPQASLTRTLVSAPPDEPGGDLVFALALESSESDRNLRLTALTDTLDGNLDGRGNCDVPQTISPGGRYECSYTVTVTDATAAEPRTSTTEATLSADGVSDRISAAATVTFGDVPPDAGASLSATPVDPVAPEADVVYSVVVQNGDDAEPLSITELDDDALGDLDGRGNCSLPASIAPAAVYECTYTATVSGQPDETVTRTLGATLTDDEGNTTTAGDQAAVTFRAENTAPTTTDDAFAGTEDTTLTVDAPGVLANDTDAESDPLSVLTASEPQSGTLVVQDDGSFIFEPEVDFAGTVDFVYRATDGALNSEQASVTITVAPVNDAPVAANDAFATNGSAPLEIPAPGVLANDRDVDSPTLTARSGTPPAFGTVVIASDGGFTYTPGPNYSGSDTFTYFADDGELEREAEVTLEVNETLFASSFEARPGS